MRPRSFAASMLPLAVLLSAASCQDATQPCSEPCQLERAARLATGDSMPLWPTAHAEKPVRLYVDRSGSMRGFLDPDYPGSVRTDYRSVLDGFAARLKPAEVSGFGTAVRTVRDADLGVLGDPTFYTDGNTELEEVLRLVEADTNLDATHVIVGDGRRTDPDDANRQFVRMRNAAERWTGKGGTFVVAASLAPFQPVGGDVSGCRAVEDEKEEGEDQRETCPLYAFAFVAPGDAGRVAAALAGTFDELFVTPLPAVPATGVRLEAPSSEPAAPAPSSAAAKTTLEPGWARNAAGAPIARVRGSEASNQPLRARIVVGDTTSPVARAAWTALRGRRLVPHLHVRGLAADSTAVPWAVSGGGQALLRPRDDVFDLDFITRGPSAPPYLYRLELRPEGVPAWLPRYDAERASDGRRTYGLGRLFEGVRAADPLSSPPVLRLYAVVN